MIALQPCHVFLMATEEYVFFVLLVFSNIDFLFLRLHHYSLKKQPLRFMPLQTSDCKLTLEEENLEKRLGDFLDLFK